MAAASFRSQKSHPHGFVRRGIIIASCDVLTPVERPAHHGELPKLGFEIDEIPPRQPALRAHLDHHHKSRLRAQRSPRRQDDDRAARSADPTSSRSGNDSWRFKSRVDDHATSTGQSAHRIDTNSRAPSIGTTKSAGSRAPPLCQRSRFSGRHCRSPFTVDLSLASSWSLPIGYCP